MEAEVKTATIATNSVFLDFGLREYGKNDFGKLTLWSSDLRKV